MVCGAGAIDGCASGKTRVVRKGNAGLGIWEELRCCGDYEMMERVVVRLEIARGPRHR